LLSKSASVATSSTTSSKPCGSICVKRQLAA
jgi:hypothetical protein